MIQMKKKGKTRYVCSTLISSVNLLIRLVIEIIGTKTKKKM